MSDPNLCECGCGQPAPLASRNRPERGWVKGEPIRFLPGHQNGHNRRQAMTASDQLGQRAGVGQPAGAQIEVGSEGGTFTTGALDHQLNLATDWDDLLRSFGLDPDVFYVVDDTVRMSKWQQSKGLDDGSRDVIWLYSYKARFARRKLDATAIDIDELRRQVQNWVPLVRGPILRSLSEPPSTFVVGWSDWQLGKSAGGGVEVTIRKIEESFILAAERLEELRANGRNIEKVAVLQMGDPTESCYGHYDSQLFTVELTQREQLDLCLDLQIAGVKILQPDIFAATLCNHGEWTRQGTGQRPVTSDSDNVSGYLADTLRRVFDGRPGAPTEWAIPHDNIVTPLNLSGVPVAITHGHKIPSANKERDWLRDQSIRLLRQTGIEPRLWLTAHRHHVRIDDFGPFWRLQHPTLDGGSKYFEDGTGTWSTPGTLTELVGWHDVRCWSDLAVLGTSPAYGYGEVAS